MFVVPANLLLALARQRLGQTGEARQALTTARRLMERCLPPAPELDGNWHNWFICQLRRREAEAVVKK
jgi:hypothetical protein